MSVNKVVLVGRLGQDPEYKELNSGALAKLNVATTERYKDKYGDKKEETQWHNVVVWGKLAKNCTTFLSKGSQVYIEGVIKYKTYEDNNGVKKYFTEITGREIQFLDSKPKQENKIQHQKSHQLDEAMLMADDIFKENNHIDPQTTVPF